MSETVTPIIPAEELERLRERERSTLEAGRSQGALAVDPQFRNARLASQERARLKGKARALGLLQDFGPVVVFERLEALEAKLDQVLALLTEPKGKK
jgi:hypothetical protein